MLEGKVIWITGASSGIGKALAKAAAKAGMRVIISARNEAELERVRLACGGQTAVLPMDVSKHNEMEAFTSKAAVIFGPIDILVNNAGVGQRGLAVETELEVVKRIFDINFFGSIALAKAILPSMIDRKSGTIVALSSVLGSVPLSKRSAYVASKHAIEGFYQTLRLELFETGVKVLIVRPGLIDTNFSKNAFDAKGAKRGDDILGKWGKMKSDACAKRILSAIQNGHENLLVGGIETWGVLAKQLLPSAIFNSMVKSLEH